VSGYVDRVQGKFPEEVQGKFKLGSTDKPKADVKAEQAGCSC
jgi:hypothetical protein